MSLDLGFRSGNGGRSGGTGFTSAVANYSALPAASGVSGEYYWASAIDVVGGVKYPAGAYRSNGTTWEFDTAYTQAAIWGSVTNYAALPLGATAADPQINDLVAVNSTTGIWLINQRLKGYYRRVAMTGVAATDYGTEPFAGFSQAATQSQVDTGTDTDSFVNSVTFNGASKWGTKQDIPIVVSGNTTAANDTNYTNVATATYTDPSPVEGKGFTVIVRDGTATVGGVAYANAGSVIRRIFHSGAWANYYDSPFNDATSSIQTQISGKQAALSGIGFIKITGTTISYDNNLYLNVLGGDLTGTGGAGFHGFISQSSAPTTPSSGFRLYADSSNRLSWRGQNGFIRTFDGTSNTANRTYTLPDASGNIMLNPMTTLGDTIYGAASGVPTRIPIGARGTIYQVGASSVPQWNSNILDSNGNTILGFTPIGSAVNSFTISNSVGTNSPILSTPNSGAGTDQIGIGGQIDLGLGTGAGNSGRLTLTTGGILATSSTVQTRFSVFQVGAINTTSGGLLVNSNGGVATLSSTSYTLLQASSGLFINNIIASTPITFRINNTTLFTLTNTSTGSFIDTNLRILDFAKSSNFSQTLLVRGAAHTSLTASTEQVFSQFDPFATRTWLAGTVSVQRDNLFQAAVYAGASATATFTTAATVAITGAPTVGANASITTPLAFWVQGGTSRFDGLLNLNPSYVTAGTTGNRTSNTPSGNIRIAAAGTTATLTNNLIVANSRVFYKISNDTTAKSLAAAEAVGSCVFTLNAAATAEVEISWFVLNN